MNLSLHSVDAVLMLAQNGDRLYAKYYNGSFPTLKQQRQFEASILQKTHKQDNEILLLQDKIVIYKEFVDMTMCLVGNVQENEILLNNVFNTWKNSMDLILVDGIDSKNVIDHYDMCLLIVDEIICDGIILETDSQSVASRVTKNTASDSNLTLDLDKGLLSAWGFAKSKFQEKLQQGL